MTSQKETLISNDVLIGLKYYIFKDKINSEVDCHD